LPGIPPMTALTVASTAFAMTLPRSETRHIRSRLPYRSVHALHSLLRGCNEHIWLNHTGGRYVCAPQSARFRLESREFLQRDPPLAAIMSGQGQGSGVPFHWPPGPYLLRSNFNGASTMPASRKPAHGRVLTICSWTAATLASS
jgi:hypothetical protein